MIFTKKQTRMFLLLAAGMMPLRATTPGSLPGEGLYGQYFNNPDLSGSPVLRRTDRQLDFTWGSGSPGEGVRSDNYSVRWTGSIAAPVTGNFTFSTLSDDGVRLWVNGEKVIDNWTPHSPTINRSKALSLTAGKTYAIKLEYFERTGGSTMKLLWSYPGQADQAIPQIRLYTPDDIIYLSDQPWASAKSGWGPVERDRSNGEDKAGDGKALSLNGLKFAKGLGTHAYSEIIYTLDRKYDEFYATIGVDDEVDTRGSVVFEAYVDGLRVFQSPTMRGSTAARFVRVDLTGRQQLRLVVTDAGDGIGSDHANWADAHVLKNPNGTPAPPPVADPDPFLSDIAWKSAKNGWGPVERNMSNGEQPPGDGKTLTIGGRKFAKGLGMHPASEIVYTIGKAYKKFVAEIGVDDEVSDRGTIVFSVWGDGKKLFDSPMLSGKMQPMHIEIDVTGVQELLLKADGGGDGIGSDHGDWADARLFRTGTVTPPPPPPQPPVAPSGLAAQVGDKQLRLTWNVVPGAVSYSLFRSTSSNGQSNTPLAKDLTAPTFTDSNLTNSTAYFYKVTAVNAVGSSPRSAEISAIPLAPVTPPAVLPATDISALRLLRQSTWGPTEALLARVKQVGADAFLEEQFAAPASTYPDTLLREGSVEPTQERFFRNALVGEDQLRQRVAFALSQILVVSAVEIDRPDAFVPYIRILQEGAFGRFDQLLRQVTLNPAMGEYLDMVNNKKGDPAKGIMPNENFAREVLQLFTLGLAQLNPDGSTKNGPNGPLPTYSQEEVLELSRVFTGWTYGDTRAGAPTDPNGERYDRPMEAVERYHDTGQKQFLGATLPPNQTATQDLDAALAVILRHPNVAPFISRQLIQRLVTSNPSPAYIADVADTFTRTNGDLKAVVKRILLHPQAQLTEPTAGKLREPALFITTQLRALGATVADHPFMSDLSAEMGQRVFYSPSVFNYFSPTFRIPGTTLTGPEFQLFTTATGMIRANFVAQLLNQSFGNDVTVDFTPWTTAAADAGVLLNRIDRLILGGTLSPPMRAAMLDAINRSPNAKEKALTALYIAFTSSQFQVER
jgi:uncharacterized protein (DUF1800 family)